jgi:hypothetical protein
VLAQQNDSLAARLQTRLDHLEESNRFTAFESDFKQQVFEQKGVSYG